MDQSIWGKTANLSVMKYFTLSFFGLFLAFSALAGQPGDSLNLVKYLNDNQIEFEQTKEGLYYTIERVGSGRKPQRGDYVKVHFRGTMLNGRQFDASKPNDPFVFQLGYRQVISGWDLGIALLNEGSKGTLYIPPQLAYGTVGVGNTIPPNAPLIFEIELLSILTPEEYDRHMIELEKKERHEYEKQKKKQFREDLQIIEAYAKKHKMRAKRTDSGLSYVIKKRGKKNPARPGDELTVHYEGQLTDGTVFAKSFGREPFKFQLGKKKAIEGWEEGLQFFGKGGEGWLLIPSRMAYGPRAIVEKEYTIPANSVLIFKIKVLNIERAD